MIEFLLSHVDKLAVVEVVVETVLLHKVVVGALLDDLAVFHDQNPVDALRMVERRWATIKLVRPSIELIKGFLNLQLGTGIDAGGGLVQNQHGRQAEHDTGDAEQLFLSLADAVLGENGVQSVGKTCG